MGMPLKEYIYISLIEVGDPCPSWLGLAPFSWTVVPDEIKRRLDEHTFPLSGANGRNYGTRNFVLLTPFISNHHELHPQNVSLNTFFLSRLYWTAFCFWFVGRNKCRRICSLEDFELSASTHTWACTFQ